MELHFKLIDIRQEMISFVTQVYTKCDDVWEQKPKSHQVMYLIGLCPPYLGGHHQMCVLVSSKDKVAVRTSVPMGCV